MSDSPKSLDLKATIEQWFTFSRSPPLTLRRSYRLRVPTLGGPSLWGDVHLEHTYRIQKHHLTGHCRILDRKDRRVFWGTREECMAELNEREDSRPVSESGQHLVLCLHGIFRSKNAMNPIRDALIEKGFNAWSINYPSTLTTISEHADQIRQLLLNCEGVHTVSFVCHSMGGLVARALLADREAPWREKITPHRLVMIGTPNQGTFVAEELSKRSRLFRLIAGPSGLQLTPEWVNSLPIPDIDFGIIAGGTGDSKGFNPFLLGDDDMTVTVKSAQLEGAKDFLLCRAIHTFIMQNPRAMDATIHFIQHGHFT